MSEILLSRLAHTWLIDVDGTMVKHNGHKEGVDHLLPGVKEFWEKIPPQDTIILLSARKKTEQRATLQYFDEMGLRYDRAIFDLPTGERILINDRKLKGLETAVAINIARDQGLISLAVCYDDR
jgi:hypothetical protein